MSVSSLRCYADLIGRVTEFGLMVKTIPNGLRKMFARCFAWSVVTYESENWAVRKKEDKYLERFEMFLLEKSREGKMNGENTKK